MPAPVVALPCGSRSISSTRRFIAVRLAARLTAVVVLPTPPFWLTTARIRLTPLHHDEMAFGVEPGHGQRGRRDDAERRRQQRDFLVRKDAFHRDQPPARGQMPRTRLREGREIGERARDHDVERHRRRVVLDPRNHGFDIRQRELDHRLLQECPFLVTAVQRHDVPGRPRDRERERRHAATAADVEHSQFRARGRGGKKRQHGERVEHVVRHHALRFADRGEVVGPVPFREQLDIRGELAARAARQRLPRDRQARAAARGPRRDRASRCSEYLRAAHSGIRPWGGPAGLSGLPSCCALRYSPLGRPGGLVWITFVLRTPVFALGAARRAHADRRSCTGAGSPSPRFRCTSNSEIAAGVMPEMRAAWPSVSGLCALRLCCTSADRPRTVR